MITGSETLRVMTFNIRGFYHPDDGANTWEHREALNVATIRKYAPDLLGVQEAQTGNLKAYDRLLPQYHWMAWPEYGDRPPHEWPTIYWRPERLKPIDSGGFWLSETPERHSRSWETDCIRSASWVMFRCVASGATLVHLNTHLDHVSELARIEGSRLIRERVRDLQAAGAAAVLTGDFNTDPGSAVHRGYLEAGYADAFVAAGNDDTPARAYTNHAWEGAHFTRMNDTPRRIDWILVRDGAATSASVRSSEIVRDAVPPVYPSDHYPLLADLVVGTGGSGRDVIM